MTKSMISLTAILAVLTLSACWDNEKDDKDSVSSENNIEQISSDEKETEISEEESDDSDDNSEEDLDNEEDSEDSDNEAEKSEEKKDIEKSGIEDIDLSKVDPKAVVATVGDEKILIEDVAKMMQMMPEEMRQMPMEIMFLAVRDQLIDMKIMQNEAKKNENELLEQEEVKEALQKAREQILMGAYMQNSTEDKVGKKAIREEYKKFVKKFPTGTDEVKIHQIVVKKEKEAKAIIEDLDLGIDFFKLAREKSVDKKTAEKNGEVPGYLSVIHKESLLPGFEILFEKKNNKYIITSGSYTKKPIKTPMGYFVLKVMERRPIKVPKLSDLKSALKSQLTQKALEDHVKKLRKSVKVSRYHPNTGKPMKSLDNQLEKLKDMLTNAIESKKIEKKEVSDKKIDAINVENKEEIDKKIETIKAVKEES